jgi:hypothetical protein
VIHGSYIDINHCLMRSLNYCFNFFLTDSLVFDEGLPFKSNDDDIIRRQKAEK